MQSQAVEMRLSYGHSIGSVLLLGATLSAQGAWTDPSPHAVSFVGIEQGVALEVLDWGGQGPPMILLAGLGNTAHVFDQFALHFTDRFHVIGITRRGYGASGHPSDGYEIASLANDIRVVCDRLKIDRAILVGHSLAGDEMTKFAGTYPNLVSALVYLDAAYDRTKMPPEGIGPQQSPTPDDLASIEKFAEYSLRTTGSRRPEADIRWAVVTDAEGHLLRGAIPSTTTVAIMRGLERPDYAHVQAPALAIYQPNELRFNFPNYANFSDADKARAEAVIRGGQPFVDRSIGQFSREMAHGRVVRLTTGTHYLFITNEDEVVRMMREFLSAVLRS
jgi:non-heme chloroperoxidase